MEITYKEEKDFVYVKFKNCNDKNKIQTSLNDFQELWVNYYEKKKEFYFHCLCQLQSLQQKFFNYSPNHF